MCLNYNYDKIVQEHVQREAKDLDVEDSVHKSQTVASEITDQDLLENGIPEMIRKWENGAAAGVVQHAFVW